MKPLLITLAFATVAIGGGVIAAKRKPVGPLVVRSPKGVGPCEPYAEVCRHCSDCSTCKHCAGLGGKCSVCFKK
jgi:hypothetical protein